jgi:hypothetical protein
MKMLLIAAALAASMSVAPAQYLYGAGSNPNRQYVRPHTNSNGTYVQGHYRTPTTRSVTITGL